VAADSAHRPFAGIPELDGRRQLPTAPSTAVAGGSLAGLASIWTPKALERPYPNTGHDLGVVLGDSRPDALHRSARRRRGAPPHRRASVPEGTGGSRYRHGHSRADVRSGAEAPDLKLSCCWTARMSARSGSSRGTRSSKQRWSTRLSWTNCVTQCAAFSTCSQIVRKSRARVGYIQSAIASGAACGFCEIHVTVGTRFASWMHGAS
jgi:hypothetical protein